MRVSFLSISITCCYYLLVFCFPAAMWKSVGMTCRVAMWSLVDVCFDNSRFWYSVKENIRSVGCRRSGLCIYCAFRWSGEELRSRQPGLACRAQVEGGQGGNRGASSGPGWYSMPVSAGGQVGALWSGTRSLRDASLNFLRAMFYCGGFHNVSFARLHFLYKKCVFVFLLLRPLLGRPRIQGLVYFHTPCSGFF